ncbi:MAG: DUF892 family protein [Patescibacteria group bacterium]
MHLRDLSSLLSYEVDQLKLMEQKIARGLEEMIEYASHQELITALQEHLEETKQQLVRLEKMPTIVMNEADKEDSEDFLAVDALIEDGSNIAMKQGNPTVKDAALIAAAQRIEHYEMGAYGAAKAHAKALKFDDMANVLDENLKEEENSDKKLSNLAEGNWFMQGINEKAEKETGLDI